MPIGAITGDFVGSRFERHNITLPEFAWHTAECRLTDDSVLTGATCRALLGECDYRTAYRDAVRMYGSVGFGPGFQLWALGPDTLGTPQSTGCGASIRVSPIGWAFDDMPTVLEHAERSARSTHDTDTAVLGAQAVAGCILLLRNGFHPRHAVGFAEWLGLCCERDIASWRTQPGWSSDTLRTVPVAFAALREGGDFESTVRLAVSAGGDSDSIAAMAGSLAEACWGVPRALAAPALLALDRAPALRDSVLRFRNQFGVPPVLDLPAT